MKKVGSHLDLLKAPELSSSRSVSDFQIDGVGGGFVVVNHYGDFKLSIARVDIMVLGGPFSAWDTEDDALNHAFQITDACAGKAIATELKVGGAGIVLFLLNDAQNTPKNRAALFRLTSQSINNLSNTSVLCTPGMGMTASDLKSFREISNTVNLEAPAPPSPPTNGGGTPTFSRVRARSLSDAYDCPVPKEMVEDNVLVKAGAYSALGALSFLIKEKGWSASRVVVVGLTAVSAELFWLLTKKGFDTWASDADTELYSTHKIPSDKTVPFKSVMETSADVLLLCCPTFRGSLTADDVNKLKCRALLSLHDNVLSSVTDERERALVAFSEKDIFDFGYGLMDLGTIAKAFSIAESGGNPSSFRLTDAQNLGVTLMQKTLHLDGVQRQYDPEEKLKFYSEMIGANGTPNDGTSGSEIDVPDFGKDVWDGINVTEVGAHGIASRKMTEMIWNKARNMCPALRLKDKAAPVQFFDLGSGDGTAARFMCKQDPNVHIKCINISRNENITNRQLSDEEGLGAQISVETGTFERLDPEYSNRFDGCISQDSFVHAFNKLHAFAEAYKVTKGGGFLLMSDLMCGEGEAVSAEELYSDEDAQTVTKWTTVSQCVQMASDAGWADIQFVDLTAQIKVSCQGMLNKVKAVTDGATKDTPQPASSMKLLQKYRENLTRRIGQIDRGVFKWGIIAARKPYDVVFFQEPPVVPESRKMINYSVHETDGSLKFGTDVVVLTIKDRMSREQIMALPPTTRLIVTMSAGLDHVDMAAAHERGILVERAARDQICKSVADYLLSCVVFGLRGGFQNIGVPFPGAEWTLGWNAQGIDLDDAKIGFIGMGAIGLETARRIRQLSTTCELVYHIPKGIRCRFKDGTYRMTHTSIADLYSTCDVIIPMVPLTPHTTKLVDYSAFSMMKKSAVFINMARGKVVDTDDMYRAMTEGLVRHAILDTTDPEPLPKEHPLWNMGNVTITPHFATNTIYVRTELVEDIPNQIEDTLEGKGILRLEEQRMRKELSEAYQITREFGMDELVWNHLSVKLSDGSFLITPGGRMFDDIGPQDLVKSSGNVTADIIHEAVYDVRPDVKAIVHLHTPATVAISCLEMGFVPLAQEAAPFVGKVASYPWEGVSNDREEQAGISEACKDKNINTLIMENHGFCTFGRTLGEAWVLAYYFDKSCRTQLNVLQTGQKIRYPDPKVLAHAGEQSYLPDFFPGLNEWDALRKMLSRKR